MSAVVAAFAVLAFSATQTAIAAQADAPASASAVRPGKNKAVKPKIKFLSSTQNALRAGKLKVKVTAKPKAKVRLSSTSSTFDDGTKTLTKPKTVNLGRKRAKVVTLSVTPAARAAAASCQARKITVTGRSGRKTGRASGQMLRMSADCQLSNVDLSKAADCDFIAQPKEGMCMLPFPNDYYTRADANSPTGKRIQFTSAGMPANKDGVHVDPSDYSASDGFSQGAGIALKIPGIESAAAVTANSLVPINDIGRYADTDQRVVVIDTDTGKRWPIWANIDSNAHLDQDRLLEIKPAKNFSAEGHYIVALRNLTDVDGTPLQAPTAFRYYRDQIPSAQGAVNARRGHFEDIFKSLKKAGIKRSDLYLAWDFTVASDENNYARALSMRDRAFQELGDTNLSDQTIQGVAPAFTVDSVTNYSIGQNSKVARRVIGHYTVPCFLEPNCLAGGTMDLGSDGLPTRNGNYSSNFDCIIPRVALDGPLTEKMRPMMFGHGLFGRADGVTGSVNPQLAQEHKMVVCGTDEIGMSGDDPVQIIPALMDLSKFEVLPDRLAQGLLNELFLARLMYHPDGMVTSPAFQNGDGNTAGEPVIRTDHVYYMGASQGGIMGGPLTALSPDFTQASLLVGGMNYSMLLPRSIDFDLYAGFMYPAYPNEMARPLLFSLIQMLWDRSEPNGYAHRMTDNPLPDTPKHNVTLQVALGDHQVSNFSAEVEARTVGMATHGPVLDEGRWPGMDVAWDIPRITEYPYHGSNFIYLDGGPMRPDPGNPNKTIGTTPPPFENIANRNGEDPHGAPRGADQAVEMTSTFLQPNGYIDNVCGNTSCYGGGWSGLP